MVIILAQAAVLKKLLADKIVKESSAGKIVGDFAVTMINKIDQTKAEWIEFHSASFGEVILTYAHNSITIPVVDIRP